MLTLYSLGLSKWQPILVTHGLSSASALDHQERPTCPALSHDYAQAGDAN